MSIMNDGPCSNYYYHHHHHIVTAGVDGGGARDTGRRRKSLHFNDIPIKFGDRKEEKDIKFQ